MDCPSALELRFGERLNSELDLRNIQRQDLVGMFLTSTAREWKMWAVKSDIPLEIVSDMNAEVKCRHMKAKGS